MKESTFQLIGTPKVNKLKFELSNTFSGNGEIELSFQINVSVYNQDITSAVVELNLEIFTDKEFESVPFIMEISIKGEFRWDDSVEDELLEVLLKQNAPAIIYSYLRPIVTNLTMESGVAPLVLPIMNFMDN